MSTEQLLAMNDHLVNKQILQKALGSNFDELDKLNVELAKAALAAYNQKVKLQTPIFAKRNAVLKKIPGFWLQAMTNDPRFSGLVDPVDRDALKHLTDVELKHDENDARNVTISLHFNQDNPYFSDRVLTKSLTVATAAVDDELSKYDMDAPVESKPVSISWSSPDHDLAKKKPRFKLEEAEEHDDFDGSVGSFFTWFGETEDPLSVGEMLIELHATAVESYAGIAHGDSSDDDDEESDDDPTAIVDLGDESDDDKPKKKKQRRG